MYDYEYEFEVLLMLRLMKLLHMIKPEAMEEPMKMYPSLPPDELYLMVTIMDRNKTKRFKAL